MWGNTLVMSSCLVHSASLPALEGLSGCRGPPPGLPALLPSVEAFGAWPLSVARQPLPAKAVKASGHRCGHCRLQGGTRDEQPQRHSASPERATLPAKCVPNTASPQYSYGSLLVLILPADYLLPPSPFYCQGGRVTHLCPEWEVPTVRSFQKLLATLSPTAQAPAQTHTALLSTSDMLTVLLPLQWVSSPFHDKTFGATALMAHSDHQCRTRTPTWPLHTDRPLPKLCSHHPPVPAVCQLPWVPDTRGSLAAANHMGNWVCRLIPGDTSKKARPTSPLNESGWAK